VVYNYKTQGFTLIELIIVLALSGAALAFVAPVSLQFYKTALLDEAAADVTAILRRAQAQAQSQKNDSAFGVAFFPSRYTLFQGVSYASRIISEDEEFSLPLGTTHSGLSEAQFSKHTGIPATTGTLILQNTAETRSISISDIGIIQIE
jgi:prepilin-type N-terminal cleavage/methylation domain-containing protein